MIHGGDIYHNKVNIDFSVSVNPLPVPDNVTDALKDCIGEIGRYPDIECSELSEKVSCKLGVKKENLVFSNGSSEIFMAIAHALRARKVLIPVPSFYGYEYAFSGNCEDMLFYPMKEEDGFKLTDEILGHITSDLDALVIANPNNPTGAMIEEALLSKILNKCLNENVRVIIDECFIEFADEKRSLIGKINDHENLCIIRSFTKIYAIPNVRLGYMICSDLKFVKEVRKHLPEWNVSGFAQAAGKECLKCDEYVRKSVEYTRSEKEFLENEFAKLKIKTFPSDCNYILICSELPLYDLFLEKGIMIRNCDNFRGLKKGYYRIAVKSHGENIKLITEIV